MPRIGERVAHGDDRDRLLGLELGQHAGRARLLRRVVGRVARIFFSKTIRSIVKEQAGHSAEIELADPHVAEVAGRKAAPGVDRRAGEPGIRSLQGTVTSPSLWN